LITAFLGSTMKRVNYDEVSTVYDQRYRSGGPVGIAKFLRELISNVNAHCMLEVGCGTGYWLTLLRHCDIRCGLDYSAGMLDKARHKDGSLRLVRGIAAQLPFYEGAFGVVFCVHALHHFDDPLAFTYEAWRVLRTGGALVIIGMDPHTKQDRWYIYDYFPGTYETDLARYPSGQMIQRWMKEAGFVKCERRLASHISCDFIGRDVLRDPILHKNGTSQLSLLTEDAFVDGMARIRRTLHLAERHGEEVVFSTHIALPIMIGFVPDTA
jgi:ubiquinone/menaquinone biosynthesis C-methylase UbiE